MAKERRIAGLPAPADLNASELAKRLHKKYNGDDFALCFDVRNDAGFSASRTADAIGVGLWPSRGCHVYGFEIKASRGDWLRELADAGKAEAFVAYCDYWLIVAGSRTMVNADELPEGWGLLVPRADTLEIAVAPKRNEKALPIPRGMLVSMLKRAQTQNPNNGVVADAFERGKKEGIALGERKAEHSHDLDGAKRLKAAAERFTKDTGINIEYSYDAPLLAKAMASIRAGRTLDNTRMMLRRMGNELRNSAGSLDEIVKLAEAANGEAQT